MNKALHSQVEVQKHNQCKLTFFRVAVKLLLGAICIHLYHYFNHDSKSLHGNGKNRQSSAAETLVGHAAWVVCTALLQQHAADIRHKLLLSSR